jgi:hypothetical protein
MLAFRPLHGPLLNPAHRHGGDVTCLDGDPDRPVVTGVVPNARQKA